MSAAPVCLRATAADVEVELNGQVLSAECLAGVGEGLGFQPLVQCAQVGRWRGGAVVLGAGQGDVPGPVGGDQQGQDPAERCERDQQAHGCCGGPDPGPV